MPKLKALTERQIIDAVKSVKNPGQWRSLKWIHNIVDLDGQEVIITYEKSCRIGIKYDNMKAVKETKAKEDAEIGAPKERRESSYVRLTDKEGKFVEPIFFVRSRLHMDRKYLQVMKANRFVASSRGKVTPEKTKIQFFKEGVEFTPTEEELKVLMADKKKSGPTETWVLPLNKILSIN